MCAQHEKPYMTCHEVLDFLMAYLDGELSDEQRREFDRHLAVCPSCVNYLEGYKATIQLTRNAMRGEGQAADPGVPEGLIKAIREARKRGG